RCLGPEPPMPLDPVRRFAASLTRWEKAALASWGLMLTLVCVRTAIWPKTHTVYPIFALASQNWLAGASLYGQTPYDIYRYSPLVAAAFVPLGFLPLWLGGVCWRLLEAGVYATALTWWCRSMSAADSRSNPIPNHRGFGIECEFGQDQKSLDRNWLAVFLLLLLPLSADNLNNGQSNLLMIGLVVLGIVACSAERWNLAGACAAAACLLKIYPVVIAMLLSVTHPRRFAPRFVIALAAGILLPFLL